MSGNQPLGCVHRTSMCVSDSAECTGQDRASSVTAAERAVCLMCNRNHTKHKITLSGESECVPLSLTLSGSAATGQKKKKNMEMCVTQTCISYLCGSHRGRKTCFHLVCSLMLYRFHAYFRHTHIRALTKSHTGVLHALATLKCTHMTAVLFFTFGPRLLE